MAVVDFIHLRMLVGVRAYVYIGGGEEVYVCMEGGACIRGVRAYGLLGGM